MHFVPPQSVINKKQYMLASLQTAITAILMSDHNALQS
jgi:hypothetical protein